MPTKIAVKKATSVVQPHIRKTVGFSPSLWHGASEEELRESNDSSQHNVGDRHLPQRSMGSQRRRPATFRSSFLREWSDRNGEEEDDLIMATDDIRASPRLLGYLFSMIAGAVMLTSVVEFYRERNLNSEIDSEELNEFYVYAGGVVYRWKLWGAIYCSTAGVVLSFLTALVHFDTIVAPNLWVSLFRDGSLAERNWIFFLILFWAGTVHICTSTLSVGESQPNVYFTTWIAFSASAMNYGIWRESAGLQPIADKMTMLKEGRRETTYHWMWTGIYSCIFAGAATDMFYNRAEIDIRFRGDPISLHDKDWIIILAIVWAEAALCASAIVFNEVFQNSWRLPCTIGRAKMRYRCVLGWRQLEGPVIILDTAVKFWVILEYAAVDGGTILPSFVVQKRDFFCC